MAVQLQNLATNGGNTAARTTSLTPLPARGGQVDLQQGTNRPFEQVLRGAKPLRKDAEEPVKAERPEAKPKRRPEEGSSADPVEQSTDITSTSSTEAEHDSTYATEEEAGETSPPAPEAAADDSSGDDGQIVATTADAVNLLVETPSAGQQQVVIDNPAADSEAGVDGQPITETFGKPDRPSRVQAIGSTVAREADVEANVSSDAIADADAGAIQLKNVVAIDETLDVSEPIDVDEAISLAQMMEGQDTADDSSGQPQGQQTSADADPPSEISVMSVTTTEGGPTLKKFDQPEDITASGPSPTPEPAQQQPETASTSPAQKATTVQVMDVSAARQPGTTGPQQVVTPPLVPAVPAEAMFAQANHGPIVSSIRHELLPTGGTMHIRLDPPELGALQVTVRMADGIVTAQFQTSNDDATRLLSHSLHQLKHALELQGVTIDKIQVQQAPRDQQAHANADDRSSRDGGSSPQNQQDQQSRNEQQRREMLDRLWRRLNGNKAPIDLVA